MTISPDIAQTTIELMKFYVDTKKVLYGFPLITVPSSETLNIGPSISQHLGSIEGNTQLDSLDFPTNNDDNRSVLSIYSGCSRLPSSLTPFNASVVDATIKKILFNRNRTISSTRLTQILRVRSHILSILILKFSNIFTPFLFSVQVLTVKMLRKFLNS